MIVTTHTVHCDYAGCDATHVVASDGTLGFDLPPNWTSHWFPGGAAYSRAYTSDDSQFCPLHRPVASGSGQPAMVVAPAHTCDVTNCDREAVYCDVGEAGELWLCAIHHSPITPPAGDGALGRPVPVSPTTGLDDPPQDDDETYGWPV